MAPTAINIPSSKSHNPRNSSSSFSSSYSYSSSPRFSSAGTSTPPSVYSSSSCSCSSCEELPPPSPPTKPSAVSSSSSPSSNHRHQRSMPIVNMNSTPYTRNVNLTRDHGPPVVVHHDHHRHSRRRTPSQPPPPPPSRQYLYPQAVVTPGVSERRRHRSHSTGGHGRSTSTSASTGRINVYRHGADPAAIAAPVPGRTRFPRKRVSKAAAKQLNYNYSIDDDEVDGRRGGLTVLQALTQKEIDELLLLTKEIRMRRRMKQQHHHRDEEDSLPHHRHHHHHSNRDRDRDRDNSRTTSSRRSSSKKAVSFYNKTIVHDMPPSAPTPPPTSSELESTDRNKAKEPVVLISASSMGRSDRTPTAYRHNYHLEPLSPPGPSTPKAAMESLSLNGNSEFPLGGTRGRTSNSSRPRRSSGSRVL